MDKDMKDPELEKLVEGLKLKEPPREIMSDYLSGVHTKIERGVSDFRFGLLSVLLVGAVGLVLTALVWFFMMRPAPVKVAREPAPALSEKSLEVSTPSIEEAAQILEALGVDPTDEMVDLMEEEELFTELSLLDEFDMPSSYPSTQTGVLTSS